jgi:ABC-2 type transport system permease protein/sodium transport system permease protein
MSADGGNRLAADDAFAPRPTGSGMAGGTVFRTRLARLARKELREVLRDRRTILTLVLMPLLVYPLLAVVFQQHFLASNLSAGMGYTVGFPSAADYERFHSHLQLGAKWLSAHDPQTYKEAVEFNVKESADLETDVKDGWIDLGIRIKRSRHVRQDHLVELEFIYKKDSSAAETLVRYFDRRVAAATDWYLEKRLAVPNRPPIRHAWAVHTLVETAAAPRISLAALIPLILILMTITGAVYPAIDLTAGERERGTLEILVAAPVPRMGLLFAKYVCVFIVAVLTALLNLGMMVVTLQVTGLSAALFQHEFSLVLIGQIFGLLLLFAAFFSAVLLTVASFARSFKEAQAYLIPLILLALGPGIVGILPGLKLESWLSVAPLVNIVLLSRDLFEQAADPLMAAVVVGSTFLYALAGLATAARIFGAEAVLYNEQSAWSDLWRRPAEPRNVPSVGAALLCLALMFPLWFVLQGLRAEFLSLSVLWLFIWLSILSMVLFAGFPLVSAYLARVRLRTGFQLHGARITAYLGAIILGASLWPIVLQMLARLVPGELNLDPVLVDRSLASLREARDSYPLLLTLALAVPALVEEFFFRGYLFSALRARRGAVITILASALLFGFVHMITTQLFPFQRFLSSTLMGIVLGWVAWRSGSVIPGMLLHSIHNVLLGLMGRGELATPQELDWSWVLAGTAGAAVGAVLVFLGRKTPNAERANAEPA